MSDRAKQSRLNRKSFIVNSLFFLPVLSLGISLGNSQSESEFTQGIMGIARIITLALTVIYIRFTFRRLHDANRSGWFCFGLIPPFTIFLLIYLFTASTPEANKWGEPTTGLSMFGVCAKGWRIVGIVLIAIFFLYLAGLFATFLTDSLTY